MAGVEEAVVVLGEGGVVGVPTDTVYGLAVVPTNRSTVERLYEIKGRPSDKPVALLVGSPGQAEQLVELSPAAAELARRHWPGALTLVLPTRVRLPDWVGDPDRGTVGVRMPDHFLTLELLAATGPLAVTSANLSGEEPALDHREAEQVFGRRVDLYLPGACPGGTASTVIDVTGTEPVLLRQGAIQFD